MVAEAGRRAVAAGVPVEFRAARAEALPFADAALDGYRAERLYQHLANPLAALAEARRCLAPGGRIVLVDQDWDAFLLDAEDVATSRDVHRAFTDSLVGGTVGRQFRRLLIQAGFAHVRVEIDAVASDDAVAYGFIVDLLDRAARAAGLESAKVDTWSADQRQRLADGRFFMLMTHFVASATRS
jgi:ubiquinone/menaquinone biosynthesis C-methylase UbiE